MEELSSHQVAKFQKLGFLTLDSVADPREVAEIRKTLVHLFERRRGQEEGAYLDMVDPEDNPEHPIQPTIINPLHYESRLWRTPYRALVTAYARQLLGPEATWSFEHAILKPAGSTAVTPWHQDEAFRADPNFYYETISFWLPLQVCTTDSGCMRYVPGTHRGEVISHRSPGGDTRIHVLECDEAPNLAEAVDCPLDVGGATVHHGRVIHSAGANLSDTDRYAYIIGFELPPRLRKEPRSFPWLAGRQTPAMARRRAWRRRGGIAIEALRKVRFSLLKDPGRLAFELRRGLRALARR